MEVTHRNGDVQSRTSHTMMMIDMERIGYVNVTDPTIIYVHPQLSTLRGDCSGEGGELSRGILPSPCNVIDCAGGRLGDAFAKRKH